MTAASHARARAPAAHTALRNTGPSAGANFCPGEGTKQMLHNDIKVLVIGAGGLGCELLKDLCLLGFLNLDVIDMDTIEVPAAPAPAAWKLCFALV